MQGGRRTHALAIGAALLAAVGCVHTHQAQMGPPDMGRSSRFLRGEVPRELDKITLPPYVIEAPDQFLIEVVQRSPVTDTDTRLQRPATDEFRCSQSRDGSWCGRMVRSAWVSGAMSTWRD